MYTHCYCIIGGMSPNMMKALASDPEIIRMLRDKKMQDIMSAVMTGGPAAMKKVLLICTLNATQLVVIYIHIVCFQTDRTYAIQCTTMCTVPSFISASLTDCLSMSMSMLHAV